MRYILFIPVFLLSIICHGQSNNSLMDQANQSYSKGDYQKAVTLYNQILSMGKESAETYFNLGNACFKLKEYNLAILNYEKAHRLAPNDEDIKFNIRIANQYVVDNPEALPKPFFSRWSESIVNHFPTDKWAGISLFFFILFLLILGLFFFSRSIRLKRLSFWIGIFFILISIVTFAFASRQKAKLVKRDQAIIFCPRVTVKSSPSVSGTDLFLIHEGLKVQVTDSLGHWKEIRLTDGNQGWLPDSCIVKI